MEQEPIAEVIRAVAPSVAWSSLQVGGVAGCAGLTVGSIAGVVRSTTPALFAIASGVQCSALGGTFWFARQSMMIYHARKHSISVFEATPRQRLQASAVAGGFTGATVAAIFRGFSNVIPGALMFTAFGFLGQSLYNILDSQQTSIPQPNSQSIWHRIAKYRFSPMKVLTDDEYKNMLEEKLIRVEAEIALIDEEIEKLQQQKQ